MLNTSLEYCEPPQTCEIPFSQCFVKTPLFRRAHGGMNHPGLYFAWSDTSSPSREGRVHCVPFLSGQARWVRGLKNDKSESLAPFSPQCQVYLNALISQRLGYRNIQNNIQRPCLVLCVIHIYTSFCINVYLY